jgi:glycosyltransferase involved in cell wall biosynthesis
MGMSIVPDPGGRDHRLGSTFVWIDDVSLVSIAGWMATSQTTGVEATVSVNGLAQSVDWGRLRPDVHEALGVHAREFRVPLELGDRSLCGEIEIRIEFDGSPNATPFTFTGTHQEVLDALADSLWQTDPPEHVMRWRWKEATSQPRGEFGARNRFDGGALATILGESRAPGPREDLEVSNFHAHRYYRHVREHQGFWRDRRITLATADDLIDFLLWSLREFADAHPLRPLPVFGGDKVTLNRRVAGSGLSQWASLELAGSLDLTRAQMRYLGGSRTIPVRDAEEYADVLLAWLGSWGVRHRGAVLLTESQLRYLAGSWRNGANPTVAEACELSPFAAARWRESPYFRTRYPDLEHLAVRYAFLQDLWCSELILTESALFVPGWFVSRSQALMLNESSAKHPPEGDGTMSEVPSQASERVVQVRILGMISSKSGLGQNARNSLAAMTTLGLDCEQQEIALNDRTVSGRPVAIGIQGGATVNLWHVNPDNLPEAMVLAGEAIYSDAYNIAFFAWELDQQPRSHELAIELADELWVPSEFVGESFRSVTDKRVVVMPHAIVPPEGWSPSSRRSLGLGDSAFIVYSGFDLHSWPGRKNPLGVVSAFKRAFPGQEHVQLLLRIRNGRNLGLVDSDPDDLGRALLDIAEGDQRIVIDMEERGYGEVLSLVANANCYLSLHRSEGFGYGPAEALFVGTPLVVSDNSAIGEFCSPDYCHMVPCQDRYLTPGEYYLSPGGARWSEPDLGEAARLLRWVFDNESDAARMAAIGRKHAEQELTLNAMARLYGARLSELGVYGTASWGLASTVNGEVAIDAS